MGHATSILTFTVDADQSFFDGELASLLDIDLAVVAGEVLQRLAALDDLDICSRKTFALVMLQQVLELPYIRQNPTSKPRPADRRRLLHALSADMDDVVLDLL